MRCKYCCQDPCILLKVQEEGANKSEIITLAELLAMRREEVEVIDLGPPVEDRKSPKSRKKARTVKESKFNASVEANEFFLERNSDTTLGEFTKLMKEIRKNLNSGWNKDGYRDGVLLVGIDPGPYTLGWCFLKDGDEYSGAYVPRVDGETPRKQEFSETMKRQPASYAWAVLYSREVLAETEDNSTNADYELITILPQMYEHEPIHPQTLLANHFGADGGTSTKMKDSEFVAALKESYEFWADKVLIND